MDKTININGKTWYAEQTVTTKDSAKLEHVLYTLKRELEEAKALYEENKELGLSVNLIESEGNLRALIRVNELIEFNLTNYFSDES